MLIYIVCVLATLKLIDIGEWLYWNIWRDPEEKGTRRTK